MKTNRHELKIYPKHFKKIINGEKCFELRRNDRGFEIGDILCLKEHYESVTGYTGAYALVVVIDMFDVSEVMPEVEIDKYLILSIRVAYIGNKRKTKGGNQ